MVLVVGSPAAQAQVDALVFGLLLYTLGSSGQNHSNSPTYVDLNGDGRPEIIFWTQGERHWTYDDHDLVAIFSNDPLAKPRLIRRFEDAPTQVTFTYTGGRRRFDIVFTMHEKAWFSDYFATYVAKNDGSGNFGTPELLYRKSSR
ncbi:MAG: hypothetical protein Q7S26_03195 [bacterium]|nr:hypothetical protein [bacterium]